MRAQRGLCADDAEAFELVRRQPDDVLSVEVDAGALGRVELFRRPG